MTTAQVDALAYRSSCSVLSDAASDLPNILLPLLILELLHLKPDWQVKHNQTLLRLA